MVGAPGRLRAPGVGVLAFVGFIFPGEVALILGGVTASQGRVSLAAVLAAAIAGAIVGDTVGYAVGRRYGRGILDSTLSGFVKASHLDRADAYLAERGGKAVFFGRFTAALRVLIPGLAGMSGLRYRTFLAYNAVSAVGWGTLSVLLGYLGGSNWRHLEQIASRTGRGVLVLTGAVIACTILLRRRRNPPGAPSDQPPLPSTRADLPSGQSLRSVVVIPTYNEAGNVTTAIDRVLAAEPGVDVLVVDDNSPDGTGDLVVRHACFAGRRSDSCSLDDRSGTGRVFLLSRTAKGGLGAAYRAGFAWALEAGYDAVVQMDADLSHPAERIPALLSALASADVAVGCRYVPGGSVSNWSWSRRLLSWGGNVYVRLVLGLPVRDTTAGFKAFRRRALEDIDAVHSSSNGYCFQVENTWRAVRLGLQVNEVPIRFTDRSVGTSKMSGSIAVEALTRVVVWRWRELRHGAVAPTKRVLEEPSHPRDRDVAA